MSSRLTHATLVGLFTAPLVGLAALAATGAFRHPPVTPATAPALPSVTVWYATCPTGSYWGPYTNPNPCRTKLEEVRRICRQPLLAPNTPNPDFLAVEHICRDALNAMRCTCEFRVVVARLPTTAEFLHGARPPTPTEAMFGRQ